MISETNRKRRRLERDRRAAERPQPVRRIPPPPQVQDLPPAPSLRKIVRSLTNSSGDSQNSNKRDALNSDRHREPRSYPDLSTLSSMDVLQDLEFFNMHRRDSHLRHALGSLPPPLSLQPSHSQGLHIPFGHHPQQPQPGYDQYMDVPGGYATIGGNRMPTAGPSSSAQVIGQPPAPFSHHGTPVPQPNPSGFAHFAPTQGPNSGRLNPPPPGPPLPQPLPSGISHSNSSTGPGPLHGHEPRNQLPGPPPTDVQHPSLGRNEIQEMSIMTGPPHTRDGGREGSYYPSHSQPPPPKGGPGGYLISSGSHPTRRSISPVGLGPGKQGLERSWNGPGGFPVDGRGRDIIMMDDEERYLRERDRRERDRERDREQREMQDLDLLRMRERESYQHRPAGSLPPFPHHQHPQNGASGSSTPHLHHHHRPTPHHHHHVVHHHPQQSPPGGTHNHPMPLPRELDGPRPHSGPSHSLPPPPHPTEVINLSSSKPPSGPPGPSSLPGPGSAPSHWKDDNYATGPQEYREGRNKHRSSTGRPSSASSLLGHPPHDDRDRPMAMPFVMGPSHTMQSAQPSRQESSNSSPRAGNWNEDGPYRSMPPGPPLSHHPSLPPPGPSGYLGPHDGPHGHTLSPTLRYANPPSGSSGPGRSLPPLSSSQPPTPHQNSVGLSPPRNRPLHTPTSPPPASSSSGYPPPNALHRSPRYGPLPPPLRSPQSGLKMSRPSSPPSSLTSKMLSGPLPPPGSTSTSGSPLVQGPSSMHQGSASGFSSPRLTGPGGPGRATPTGPGLALPPPLHAQPPLGVPLDLKGSDHPSGIGPYPPPPPSKLGLGGSRTGSPMVMSSYPPVGPISPTASRGLAMGPGGSGMSERDRDRERERDSREKERERERDRDRERPLSPPRPLPPPPSSSAKMSVPQMVDGH
ncbi:hypothetical protein BDN72DRAFT_479039 [Pluteus cervinus]|uniref:Uncharacterized protein n=1 Tax=Pluteus cervinus TaxID=181527 RepID=A0ACD3AZR8_9AGAR|nr:hypothetical protein BDN72DRAFT_479039 [Pluteus cervinus]